MRQLLSVFFVLLLISCEQQYVDGNFTSTEVTVNEAQSWFELNYEHSIKLVSSSSAKKPLWEKAYSFDFGIKKALVIPLEYEQNLFPALSLDNETGESKNKLLSKNDLNALLIYKDADGKMQEEVLSVIPDKVYIEQSATRTKISPFQGIIMMHGWEGQFKNGFVFEKGVITRQVVSTANARLKDYIASCVVIDWYSCPGGTHAPSPQCTYMYTESRCSIISNPIGSGGFGGFGAWASGGGGSGNTGGSTGSGAGGGISQITNHNTLNPGDKEMLENRFQEFLQRGCLNLNMENYFVSNNIKFDFVYNPNLSAPAAFAPSGSQTIYMRDSPSIQQDALSEELFHAYQHSNYSGGITQYYQNGLSNIEFEAKLYKDLVSTFEGGALVGVPASHPKNSEYQDWIGTLTSNYTKYPTAINSNDFMKFLGYFKEAYPEYDKPSVTSLTGQALLNLINTSNCSK